ncbi:MFS transporter [Muricoccus radiodurans]|uniref:MFS transporter n=1 Tax=Muricoccus radiodurans TaxID=2231721 RepID=UPI003CE8C20E
MTPPAATAPAPFRGWRAVRAAFVLAAFGWGVGFYGPPVFLHAVQAARGWPVWLISAAVTAHFLIGAAVVANLPALHRRLGLPRTTAAGAVLAALGVLGWSLAAEPWQLFLVTLLSGIGWATTSAAAVNAVVAPWFVRRRPVALSAAYNGASVGGVVFSPLWVALIAAIGFPAAAGLVGAVMVVTVGWLAASVLGATPAGDGSIPDGDAAPPPPALMPGPPALPGGALWRNQRFATLSGAAALGLFAQIGLIAHLVSLLAPALGTGGAGLAAGFATACAIAGRMGLARTLRPGADRRIAACASYAVQIAGSLVLLAAGDHPVALLLGVALFGFGIGNATSLPPLIVQAEFAPADGPRAVALVTACGQAAYAFAPLAFGALRDLSGSGAALFLLAAAAQALAVGALLAGRRPSG